MEKRTTQAMSTRNRKRTMVTPPSCPRRFSTTNMVAMNQPQPHDMSMYSRCSVHWTHIRTPSSKKVETRQKRAKWGRTCFVCRVIWKSKRRKWNVTPLLHDFGGQQYIVEHCGSPSPASFCLSLFCTQFGLACLLTPSVNRIDIQALNLMGHTVTGPLLNPLAVKEGERD